LALEFALVVPLLLAFLFGAIQFGFVFAQKASLANGAREAARLGVVTLVSSPQCSQVISTARRGATTVGMSQPAVRVLYTSASGAVAEVCKVAANSTSVTGSGTAAPCADPTGSTAGRLTVETSFEAQIDIPPFGAVGRPNLTGEGTYRCEYR
jgi:Flp pilus assembly protein TadG